MVKHELAAALSALADLDFVHEVSAKGGSFITAHRWARLEDHQQRRRSAVDFLALAQHTAWGPGKRTQTRECSLQ